MTEETLPTIIETPTQDLVVIRPPDVVLAEARTAARALTDVISKKLRPVTFGGEQYLEFEDWQTVGRFYGVTAKVVHTAPIEIGTAAGFEARAVAVRADGTEISAAEAMCLNDESNWRHKPLFQLRSMAQTRACAKALRNVLAWVVVLAGYKPTPAEEMPDDMRDDRRNAPRNVTPTPSRADLEAAAIQRGREAAAYVVEPPPPPEPTDDADQNLIIAPDCPHGHGEMEWREGTSKSTGKPYAFWGCRDRECKTTLNRVTDGQIKRLYAIAKEHGVSNAEIRAYSAHTLGVRSSAELLTNRDGLGTYEKLCAAIEAGEVKGSV